MKPPLASSTSFQTRRFLSARARNSFTVKDVFSDARTAEFASAAGASKDAGSEIVFPKLLGLPEVFVTGRANSGKSSLFNAVLGRKNLLVTSSKAGRTRQLNFFRVGPELGQLVLVDAPGYGRRGRSEWGDLFDQYLQTRKELRRVYVTFNGKHRLNEYDVQMLEHLTKNLHTSEDGVQRYSIQAVITKSDAILPDEVKDVISQLRKDIFDAAPFCLPPIITSAKIIPPFGIKELRKNIVECCQD
ncbi:P-loop containing nucleoside triphosphate hydrolase protein [Armillaria gallica]|uniref:P-loop containing nucleoside triphosphate hydrolase protein n=1 Tax=Armillaria gallica TaxID=47427 RepID=A0A2H3EI72_ARMGA|nr:P-loop containing nucleoside triphosphate hydrolase protein [Armillaria gallica]